MTAFPSTSASVSNFSGTGEDTQSIVNDLDALVANAANYANVALTAANTASARS